MKSSLSILILIEGPRFCLKLWAYTEYRLLEQCFTGSGRPWTAKLLSTNYASYRGCFKDMPKSMVLRISVRYSEISYKFRTHGLENKE